MNAPLYTIDRWPHGWSICSVDSPGIPLTALTDFTTHHPHPEELRISAGIAHHLKHTSRPRTVLVIGTDRSLSKWSAQIRAGLAVLPDRELAWWTGLDVGTSSASIYAALASHPSAQEAAAYSRGTTPQDSADFARCQNLLALFPLWKPRLPKVAATWPKTSWFAIIHRWDEIAASPPDIQTQILHSIRA
jgi:hypothetical protein